MDDSADAGDLPRHLARRSEHGYTNVISLAMDPHEPEAVDAGSLWLITRQAQDRELDAWATSRRRLNAELEHLRVHLHSPHVPRSVRAVRRELDALDRKLTGT